MRSCTLQKPLKTMLWGSGPLLISLLTNPTNRGQHRLLLIPVNPFRTDTFMLISVDDAGLTPPNQICWFDFQYFLYWYLFGAQPQVLERGFWTGLKDIFWFMAAEFTLMQPGGIQRDHIIVSDSRWVTNTWQHLIRDLYSLKVISVDSWGNSVFSYLFKA